MVDKASIANVLGTIGTVFWCVQLSPQIYYLWKRKNAEGFPPSFMFLWALSGIPFSIYFVTSDSYIPMQLQPQLFTVLCSVAWIQSMYYPPYSYPKKKWLTYAIVFFASALALELGFAIPLRKVYKDGTHWPTLPFGIIATILLVAGLVPPYVELAKRKGRVVGINFLFLAMDTTGAIFSMASNFVDKIDIMGMTLYVVVAAMECGIYLSQVIWWLRFRVIRKERDEEEAVEVEEVRTSTLEESKKASEESVPKTTSH